MSIRIRARSLLPLCSMVFAFVPSAGMAAVPADHVVGPQPRTPHLVQRLVITGYFHATPEEFNLAARELDTADEATVAFFLSRESGKKIHHVLRRRAAGASWWELMQELDVQSGWLYRDNMQRFATSARRRWKSMQDGDESRSPGLAFQPLKDARFEDLVGTMVTSRYFKTAPFLVLDARNQGKSFRDIQYAFYHMGRGQNALLLHAALPADLDTPAVSSRLHTRRPAPEKDDAAAPRHVLGKRRYFD